MTTDKRVPAIYVEIEDRSLTTETTETGRSGYVVLLSDRGPHNQIVELNSRNDLYTIFGTPDFRVHGQAHYLADKFLTYSSKLYAVRAALVDPEYTYSTNAEDCMSMANAYIKMNDADDDAIEVEGNFVFTEKTNIVSVSDSTSLLNLAVGDWIFPDGGDSATMRQIIDIESDDLEITLDDYYMGSTSTGNLFRFVPFEIGSIENMRSTANLDTQDSSILFFFYAIGAGAYYNKIFIKAVRNSTLEKMYTDDDGNVLYPNMFMNISIYCENEDDGTISLLEGPWPVSLVDRTPSGTIIKDVFSGTQLYIETVINKKSDILRCLEGLGVSNMMTVSTDGSVTYPYDLDTTNRLAVQSLFAEGDLLGLDTVGNGGFFVENGENGSLYDSSGLLQFDGNDDYESLVACAYDGSLESVDGSVELILQEIYPWYTFDYILCGGYNVTIQNSARILADTRYDCLVLADTGAVYESADDDIDARASLVPWNTWNAALYVQYRTITDTHTGKEFSVTPVYHAIDCHLSVDDQYWIAEPVAGIEKGAIEDAIELAYKPNLTKLGDLIDVELNPVIVEPDGTYILTQFSTWKRLSIMKRLHVVKFVQYLKKKIPTLLKDILQRKATTYWINQCTLRVNGFLNTFLETASSSRYIALSSYSAVVSFDDAASELNVTLTIVPIRAIERIHVNIIVT